MCVVPALPLEPQGVTVVPLEGFVIKTKHAMVGDPRKVFINVCQADAVGKPMPKTQLDDQGNEQTVGHTLRGGHTGRGVETGVCVCESQGMNIPLSLGPPRETKDKSGECDAVWPGAPRILSRCVWVPPRRQRVPRV